MYVHLVKSKNDQIVYISKSIRKGNKVYRKCIKKLGFLSELAKVHKDPLLYAKQVAQEMTEAENENKEDILLRLSSSTRIDLDKQHLFNAGYLFLQKIYYGLSLHKTCEKMMKKSKASFDLNHILSDLVFSRILYPTSKRSSFELSFQYLEQPNYELHDVYRALDLLSDSISLIQSEVYKNSSKVCKRNTSVLYYDCTNFFFETEKQDDFRKYGVSKEHRPNPIVQFGLFMDGNGIPLAFNMNPGNQSEQLSPLPTEEMIEKDFGLSKFIYCSDAGLGSYNIRWFNHLKDRSFIVTQSLKKLKGHLRDWALDDSNWQHGKSIDSLSSDSTEILIKSRPILEKGTIRLEVPSDLDDDLIEILHIQKEMDQRLIVTYSPQYAAYQKSIRDSQIERAKRLIKKPSSFDKVSSTDCRRFVKNIAFNKEGEIIGKNLYLDESLILEEEQYDGFYALVTNLDDNDEEIVAINHNRWKIEESFRIMKTEFKSRPVYVQKEGHIKAHFLTCYLALLIYRILEQRLNVDGYHFTTREIIDSLREMKLMNLNDLCYSAAFTRTHFTDRLEEAFGLSLSLQALSNPYVKSLIKKSKENK